MLAEQGLVHRRPPTSPDGASGRGPTSRIRPTRSACGRCRRTTSSSSTRRSETRVIGETDFTSGPATLHPRRSTSSKGSCIRWSGSISKGARRSCARSTATTTRRRSPTRRVTHDRHVRDGRGERACSGRSRARRGPRRLARRRVQEDQVLHERERRVGRAGSARAADAHDVVLADDSGGVMGVLPYASDDRRDGVVGLAFALRQVAQLLLMCDGHDIGISIDSGDGERCRRRRRVAAERSSSTTIIRAASGSARRCTSMHHELLDGDAAADRRVPVRERLPRLRRAGRQHRAAREGRGATDPRFAARWCRGHHGYEVRTEHEDAGRSCRFELARRSHSRDRVRAVRSRPAHGHAGAHHRSSLADQA